MKNKWQIQEAKNKLSQLLEEANFHGPQIITKNGVPKAIVLSVIDFNKLQKPREKLTDFLLNSPIHNSGIDLERGLDFGRCIEL